VHPIFARLLGGIHGDVGSLGVGEFTLVEAAGRASGGSLPTFSILRAEASDFYGALRYVAVERSARDAKQQDRNEKRTRPVGHSPLRPRFRRTSRQGAFFPMKLVDALPVHRVVMESLHGLKAVPLDGGALKEFSSTSVMDVSWT